MMLGKDATSSTAAQAGPAGTGPNPARKKLRPGGGSFDFLAGAYKDSRRKARQRFIAITAGSSIFALMLIFCGYTVAASGVAQNAADTAQADYVAAAGQYTIITGDKPQTRAQLQQALDAAATSLKLAATSSVDLVPMLAEIMRILPPGATIKDVTVTSWTDPALAPKPSTSPSPGASAEPPPPQTYIVSIIVSLPVSQVPLLESNVAALPFYGSQTSSTTRSPDGTAVTTLLIATPTPLSSPDMQALAGGRK